MDRHIVEEFAYSLRHNLLSDDYGGWNKLDRQFLEDLCERLSLEAEIFITKTGHEKCEEKRAELESTVKDKEEEIEKLELSLNEAETRYLELKYHPNIALRP